MPNNDNLAKLVAIVGAGNVGGPDKFLPSAADTFDDVLKSITGERHDVEKKKRHATTRPLRKASSADSLHFF